VTATETTAEIPAAATAATVATGAAQSGIPDQALITAHRRRSWVARAGGVLRRWARGPAGRVALPGLALMGVLAASGAGGRWLIPQMAPAPVVSPSTVVSPGPIAPSAAAPILGQSPDVPLPSTSGSAAPGTQTRPVDALQGWATRMSPTLQVSAVALGAYGYAQLTVAQTIPACHLSWTTLAGIGMVESNHGTANNSTLQPDGKVLPPIIGPALNGQAGNKLVPDTDGGTLDGDRTYDHAVGPMQFLPSTWQQYKTDGDGDGVQDPNDINDAALAAGNYLCAGGRDLATPGGWWAAVLSYNAIQSYAQSVFDAANSYGLRSRTVA
jgi:hypothetical protein